MQRWPLRVKICARAASTARSGSASSKTTTGDLPPSSTDERFSVGAPAAMIVEPVVVSPVKQMSLHVGMRRQRRAGGLAEAVDDVEDARRQLGLARGPGEQRRGERRPLGGLEDDRVARGQRRRDAPGRQHERRVPGHDHPGNADGLVDRVVQELVAHLEGPAVQLGDDARVVLEVLRGAGREPAHLLDRHADVEDLALDELLGVRADELGDPAQDLRALGRLHPSARDPRRTRGAQRRPRRRRRRPARRTPR